MSNCSRMETFKIFEDAIPIVKDGLNLEGKILKFNYEQHTQELKRLEKKNKLSTKDFLQKFNSGKLGDEGEWFDWLFAYKAVQHLKKKLEIYEKIKL